MVALYAMLVMLWFRSCKKQFLVSHTQLHSHCNSFDWCIKLTHDLTKLVRHRIIDFQFLKKNWLSIILLRILLVKLPSNFVSNNNNTCLSKKYLWTLDSSLMHLHNSYLFWIVSVLIPIHNALPLVLLQTIYLQQVSPRIIHSALAQLQHLHYDSKLAWLQHPFCLPSVLWQCLSKWHNSLTTMIVHAYVHPGLCLMRSLLIH